MRWFFCLLCLISVLSGCGTPKQSAPQVSFENSLTQSIESGQLTGSALAEAHLMRGQQRLLHDNADGALADFAKAEAEAPGTADIYIWRANAYVKKKDFAAAAADYQKLLQLLPQDKSWIICIRAAAWREGGRYFEELADYETVLREEPDFWLARAGRGMMLAKSGRSDEALPDLTYAIERAPKKLDFPERLLSLPRYGGFLLVKYEVAVTSDAGVKEALRERAYIYFRRADYERAITDFESYAEKSFRDPEPKVQIGLAQFALGQCRIGYQSMRTANWFTDEDLDQILEKNRAFIEKTECADFVF